MGILPSAGLWAAAAQSAISFTDPLTLVLSRLVNPQQAMLGGGTHNSIHYSCLDEQTVAAGFLPSSPSTLREVAIGTIMSADKAKPTHLLSIGSGRFALFHESGARNLIVRMYAKGVTDKFEDREIIVEELQDPAYGRCSVVLSVEHGAIFKCWTTQAGVGKKVERVSTAQPSPYGLGYAPHGMGYAPSAPPQ